MTAADRLIVALDHTELAPALRLARRLRGLVRTVKIGSVLFTASGPAAIDRLRGLGFRVMLDLKFFDIPNTVELSCRAAARHRVSLVTVHALGGPEMLRAAVRGARTGAARGARPLVLAVTVLTSAPASVRRVVHLAQTAAASGCDGVVASAREIRRLRTALSRRITVVCPGIRPAGAARQDQRRIATPARAIADGADWLVIGRPITEADDPRAAVRAILADMKETDGC